MPIMGFEPGTSGFKVQCSNQLAMETDMVKGGILDNTKYIFKMASPTY